MLTQLEPQTLASHLNPLPTPSPSRSEDPIAGRALRKAAWRILPFLFLLYVFNILDRVNVGFARLTMQDDLGMSEDMFNIGFGIFYIGYLFFEVPSNLILVRVGARRWIARIMVSWGIVSISMMFVTSTTGFYVARFLLGVAEAGFFPGIILYLTQWFPARMRARMVAYFMMAVALASVIGNPISGAIMQYMHSFGDLKGWQWLFLLEGIPSVLLGIATLYLLTDRPSQARWLTSEEREHLGALLQHEEEQRTVQHGANRLSSMFTLRVWHLIAVYFTVAVGTNAAGAYLPTLIKGQFPERTPFEIGLLSALPYACAVLGMAIFSYNSDRTGERRGHVAVAAFIAAIGWSIGALADSPGIALLGFCIAQLGMMSMLPTFWALPTAYLSGAAAAGGIALINSVANIGGFLGPTILGQLGMWAMVGTLLGGAVLVLFVQEGNRNRPTL